MKADALLGGGGTDASCEARLSEAHHRIANNLALIAGFVRLQASGLTRDGRTLSPLEGRRLLEEIGARIELVGRLHRQLSVNRARTRIDLGAHLSDTCEVLADSVSQDNPITLRCEAQDCEIDADRAGLLSLIITELVTNAVKYAHPAGVAGRIDVRCRGAGEGMIVVTVSDDGVGLPEGLDPDSDGGLGMRVMRSLVAQLDADVMFESSGVGLTAIVTAPIERAPQPPRDGVAATA